MKRALVAWLAWSACACVAPRWESHAPRAPSLPTRVSFDPRTIDVDVGGGQQAHLGAWLAHVPGSRGPAFVWVPGAGDVGRDGVRPSDGVRAYASAVPVARAWGEALASRGASVLSWDKRTCGPNDDVACTKNPQTDVDADGPVALAKDVDAACDVARADLSFDGRIVLLAHGQAAQVALSSSCAKSAAAIVLLAPIPRGIDKVTVARLQERGDKSAAATEEAFFSAIRAKRFDATARAKGATIAFWSGWLQLTEKTPELVRAAAAPVVVVLGDQDVQYAREDRARIEALARPHFVLVPGADHHLLPQESLSAATVDAVVGAVDAALNPSAS